MTTWGNNKSAWNQCHLYCNRQSSESALSDDRMSAKAFTGSIVCQLDKYAWFAFSSSLFYCALPAHNPFNPGHTGFQGQKPFARNSLFYLQGFIFGLGCSSRVVDCSWVSPALQEDKPKWAGVHVRQNLRLVTALFHRQMHRPFWRFIRASPSV